MASSDNPIFKVVEETLGLKGRPTSFADRITRLDFILNGAVQHGPNLPFTHLVRGEHNIFESIGATRYTNQLQIKSLQQKLVDAGLVPSQAGFLFDKVIREGGSFHYNESTNALFYGTDRKLTALPLQLSSGHVSFGGKNRMANRRRIIGASGSESYTEIFYSNLASGQMSSRGDIHKNIMSTRSSSIGGEDKLSSLLDRGTLVRGVPTPREALWKRNLHVLTAGPASDTALTEALRNRRLAQMSFATMVKTGGRVIPDELTSLYNIPKGPGQVEASFAAIKDINRDYLSTLTSFLESNGLMNAVPFIKPEYLGSKKKFLVGDATYFAQKYGTRFEKHSVEKGLFQLAKMDGSVGLRVGVIDFLTDAHSRMLLQEGGAFVTQSGVQKLMGMRHLPMGTAELNGASDDVIKSVERLYGVNLGAGYNQAVNASPLFTAKDIEDALLHKAKISQADFGAMTETQRDLRRLVQSSGKYRGLVREALDNRGRLGKIELTETGLRMDFVTQAGEAPGALEFVLGGRRKTGNTTSPLESLLSKEQLSQFDVFITADEFHKNFGAQAYVDNLRIRGRGHLTPDQIKNLGSLDADDAFKEARNIIRGWRRSRDAQLQNLAREMQEGTEILSQQQLRAFGGSAEESLGITGIRAFGLTGAMRTDFMGDINMMNPLTFTASKMATIASGAKHLGYNDAYEHPIFKLLADQSKQWRNKLIGIDTKTNQLVLSADHTMRQYANALLGDLDGVTIKPSQLVTLGKDGFYRNGAKLTNLPAQMSAFSARTGGHPISSLEDTLLGIKEDLIYLDLGGTKTLNILGTDGGSRAYSKIPIHLKALRADKGVRGNLVIGKTNPGYELIKALTELQSTGIDSLGDYEGKLASAFFNINQAMGGRKGLFNMTNTIRIPGGTRARLIATRGGYHNFKNWTDPSKLFDLVVNRQEFGEMLRRKAWIAPEYVDNIRKIMRNKGSMHVIMGADPTQRAEHINAFRLVFSDQKVKGAKIGQLTVEAHPSVLRMLERDTDRDVVSFLVSQGLDPTSTKGMEELVEKQTKLMAPFLWYDKYLSMKAGPKAATRFRDMRFVRNIADHLSTYLGAPKSLGYTITRGTETIMDNIIGHGVEGAKTLGILGGDITEEMITTIAKPYADDVIKHGVGRKLLQNLFQGAVQKGQDKASLEGLAESLVVTGRKYRGANFNYDNLVKDTQKLLEDFLINPANKNRALGAIGYMTEKHPELAGSLELMMKDLERGSSDMLTGAAKANRDKLWGLLAKFQADELAPLIGPGMMLSGSVQSAPRGISSIIQSLKTSLTGAKEVFKNIISPASGTFQTKTGSGFGITIEKEVLDAAKGTKGIMSTIGDFLKTDTGHLLAGIGIGIAGAGAFMGMMSGGPQPPPMPRDIDARQPTDMGPDIISRPPRIYGSNQVFGASKSRSPETFTSMGPYSFGVNSDPRITIRDKTSPMNPYLLEKHLKSLASSDYSYQ